MVKFGQCAFQGRIERDVARAARDQEQQSRRWLLANHMRDQIKAAAIGPLEIVKDENETAFWGCGCDGSQESTNSLI